MRELDLPAFAAFCRAKPAQEQYDPSNANKCAYFQFSGEVVLNLNKEFGNGFARAIFEPVENEVGRRIIYTFGSLADRLEALIKENAHA